MSKIEFTGAISVLVLNPHNCQTRDLALSKYGDYLFSKSHNFVAYGPMDLKLCTNDHKNMYIKVIEYQDTHTNCFGAIYKYMHGGVENTSPGPDRVNYYQDYL